MDEFSRSLGIVLIGSLMIAGLSIVLAFPTMLAWNYVMPYLLGLKAITFWHGLALNYLSGTLIKSSLSQKK